LDQVERQWLEISAGGMMNAPKGWVDIGDRRFDTTGVLGVSKNNNQWSKVKIMNTINMPQ
jgi:hypothetical protein